MKNKVFSSFSEAVGRAEANKISFIYAANNHNGLLCAQVLRDLQSIPALILLHPLETQKFADEICALFPDVPIVEWKDDINETLKSYRTDTLLSVNFGYRFTEEILELYQYPINLHTGYLPYNRGAHPNVWAIYDGTPAGVTLHLMTKSLDSGKIIAQKKIEVTAIDTGKSLYAKLENASVDLLREFWPQLSQGRVSSYYPQEEGSYHSVKDFKDLCFFTPDDTFTTLQLVRRLKALHFPPYQNAYTLIDGKRFFFDLHCEEVFSEETQE